MLFSCWLIQTPLMSLISLELTQFFSRDIKTPGGGGGGAPPYWRWVGDEDVPLGGGGGDPVSNRSARKKYTLSQYTVPY